jgi:hypothetical protein
MEVFIFRWIIPMNEFSNDARRSRASRLALYIALSPLRVWRGLNRAFVWLMQFSFGVFLIFFIPFVIGNFVLSTPKARAYRNLHPSLEICKEGLAKGWTVLAQADQKKLESAQKTDDDGWIDPSNDENDAIAKDKIWATRLRCALQRHIVLAATPGAVPLDYHLGFLEFQESGDPYSLTQPGESGDKPITSKMLKEFSADYDGKAPISQLDILKKHLSGGSNYVIVFAHGWRHDASIGDGNVGDIRHYAAHAARFLSERCAKEGRYCDTKVTAIYIGWRGARVDETGMKRVLGRTIGGFLGQFASGATLFDRKPVSERVAPAAISALRTLGKVLYPRDLLGKRKPEADRNRMIIFGHSLGGNLFATGLKEDLLKRVREHEPGERVPPVVGDLVVLINPASEASNWTDIQREVWRRIAFHADEVTPLDELIQGHKFFPVDQRPVVVSVTAALAFPAGGLREGDCQWLGLEMDDGHSKDRQAIRTRLAKNEGMFAEGIDYDWATHDLFPAFKFDFRPLAQWFDRQSARVEGRRPPGQGCDNSNPTFWSRVLSTPWRAGSKIASTFPFQNTNPEYSHTIGHLDPPRPAAGNFTEYLTSAAPFGTTHELIGSLDEGQEKHHPYSTLADEPIKCPPANHWLTRARLAKAKQPYGTFWDSDQLADSRPEAVGEGPPAAQFLHGFNLGGTAAITRANDPFWNMRAFDNALARHDGYRLSSFICAMNQLVMDDIAEAPPAKPETTAPALPGSEAQRPDRVAPAAIAPNGAAPDSDKASGPKPSETKSIAPKRRSLTPPTTISDP